MNPESQHARSSAASTSSGQKKSGPLRHLTIIEMAGMGGAPFAGMMLADLGAEVIRIDRPPTAGKAPPPDILNRGKRSLCLDLKAPAAKAALLRMVGKADGLIEAYRPGVMERLGLGPEPCLAANGKLVYGRLTGFGQTGPLAQAAGHDINFIALAGALHSIGTADSGPVPPLALLADFAGGGMLLAFGLVSALIEARTTGKGQVVDAAMLDGAALLMASAYGRFAAGRWSLERGHNFMDGAAHYYTTYRCADGKWLAVGPIEPQFYALLLEKCGLSDEALRDQGDPSRWADLKERLQRVFATRSRDEWCALLEGSDACVSPVLDVAEAPRHAHNASRGVFCEVEGRVQPAPAPRFSATPAGSPGVPAEPGKDAREILSGFGWTAEEIAALSQSGALVIP